MSFIDTGSLTGLELAKQARLGENPRDLPISASPALGQQCYTSLHSFITWVLSVRQVLTLVQ